MSNQFNPILFHPIIHLQKPGNRLRGSHQLPVPGYRVIRPGGQQIFQRFPLDHRKQRRIRVGDHPPQLGAGVVSMPVAAKMAKRVRKALGSDIGVGITGWAGPDGDDVGLVFVALASRGGCFVRRLQCGHAPRPRIRLIAASNALDMIRRYLTGLDV